MWTDLYPALSSRQMYSLPLKPPIVLSFDLLLGQLKDAYHSDSDHFGGLGPVASLKLVCISSEN